MKFSQLNRDNVQQYLWANGDPSALWIFQHIPKTAGSSLTVELRKNRPPYRNFFADFSSSVGPRDQMRALAETADLAPSKKPLRSASGHFFASEMDVLLKRYPDARLFTFVRDPIERVVSSYRYSRTPDHPQWEKMLLDYPDIETFIDRSPIARNETAFFMLGVRTGNAQEVASAALERFNFIGCLEKYPASFRALSSMLWRRSDPEVRVRVTHATEHNRVELSESIRAQIERKNYLDLEIYKQVMNKLTVIERALEAPPGNYS
ncbi:sulfotransferase family 2 domain-containing protein [Plastorhodobacter daqingensis]|uniref:Sulfotransferase family 2 domain-containing protein n=1 Tax=Plastorhodobacter daqingensis TaxID=1387281 RepID=A0ABW2UI87_9RHOB